VLFIAIDDMRPSIGAPVITPAMDRLAADGLLFSRAYANFPWCNPSRNSLLSGRRPDTNRVWNFRVGLRASEPDIALPQHFKKSGYYTTSTGKIFHGTNSVQHAARRAAAARGLPAELERGAD
jgi:arylsulfatase A-like enzyme